MKPQRILIVLLGILALYLATPAAASDLIPYHATTSTTDTNGDGIPDVDAHLWGGTVCGCYCPVYTTTLDLTAAGQDGHVYDQSGGCTTNKEVSTTSGPVDPNGDVGAQLHRECWGPCLTA